MPLTTARLEYPVVIAQKTHAVGSEAGVICQEVRERDLPHPEDAEVDQRRRSRIFRRPFRALVRTIP